MRVAGRLAVGVLALLGLLAGATPAQAATPAAAADGEVRLLVAMRPGDTARAATVAGTGTPDGVIAGLGVQAVRVPGNRAAAALEALRRSPAVAWAEPDERIQAAATIPTDPEWPVQWGPLRMDMPHAWDITTGSSDVVVAVVDTGVNSAHPDLAGAMLPGRDFVNDDSDPSDDNGHGTGVAGVVAARSNTSGIAGHCWTCRVLPVKALASDGWGSTLDVAEGMTWAVDQGADVINLSLAAPSGSNTLAAAVNYAISRGVVVVAAAGNEGTTDDTFPAGYPGVIGVAGSTSTDARYPWSNHGTWVDVAAPGCQRTLHVSGGTDGQCGTSLAAPAVAGVAALALAANPTASNLQIEQAITSTAVPASYVRTGRVDGAAAVASAAGVVNTVAQAPTAVSAVPGDGSATVGWTAPVSDGGTPITGYVVTASPGGATATAAATARSATVSGLTNGTSYTFVVQATNAAGTGPASAPSAAIVPAGQPDGPTTVSVTAGAASAVVSWAAPDDGGSPITSYTVEADSGGRTVAVGGSERRAVVDGLRNGTAYRFTVRATNAAGTGLPSALSDAVIPKFDAAERTAGASRTSTAVAVSTRAFDTAGTVVIARADAYADALAAAPLAASHGGPVLLSPATALPSEVAAEVRRLGATTAILVGGTAALSTGVEAGLRDAGATTVRRIAGQNRFDTAGLIAREVGGTSVVVVEGANADRRRGWPDALAASSLAASTGQPILLVTRDAVPAETASALRSLGATKATIVGGTAAVSDAVAGALGVSAIRIAGADRYATSVAVAEAAARLGSSTGRVWVATGADWPDALAAGPAAARRGGVLLLVDGVDGTGSPAASSWLADQRSVLEELVVVGGAASVSTAAEDLLESQVL